MISLSINGKQREIDVAPDTPLLWVLRDTLQHDRHQVRLRHGAVRRLHRAPRRAAGALLLDAGLGRGRARRSRRSKRSAPTPAGKAVQAAWIKHDVPQCGYCQSGQIMSASALLAKNQHAQRRRHRRGHERQRLPLRHLQPDSRRDQGCGAADGEGSLTMSANRECIAPRLSQDFRRWPEAGW